MIATPPPRRHFVFLQGMPSPFFTRVANALHARGCEATGINLCRGDALFWHGPATVDYRGTPEDWPAFLAGFLDGRGVTDLVLLGEQRLYHRPAVELALARGIRVTVTDFGYLRPDWITLEADGMTGRSRFPRDPARILALAAQAPPVDLAPRYADSFGRMAAGDLAYSLANVFLNGRYPHYRRSDARAHPLAYFPAMARRLLLSRWRASRARIAARALADGAPCFLFPLQLDHDFQIVAYSPFASQAEALEQVFASMAAHADPRARLAVKTHPWEPGLRDWARLVRELAARHGLGGRVVFLDGGDLEALVDASSGIITVNSTSGLRALQQGKPVLCLGEAIYRVPGLASAGPLDDFWRHPPVPDAALVEAFTRALAATIQVRGVFFSEPGLGRAVEEAAARLLAGTARVPEAGAVEPAASVA